MIKFANLSFVYFLLMLRPLRAKGLVKIDSFSSPESVQQPNQKEHSDRVHDCRSNLKSYMHKWKDHEDLSKFGTFKIHNTRTVISLWTTRNPWNCTAPTCLKHTHSTTYHFKANSCFLLNSTDSNRITFFIIFWKPPQLKQLIAHTSRHPTQIQHLHASDLRRNNTTKAWPFFSLNNPWWMNQ